MVEVEGTPDKPTGRKALSLSLPAPIRWLREGLALLLWTFVIVQVFVWDVANHLAGRLPHFAFVAQFRALILLGLITASWLILGNRRFMLFVGYIIAYPFVFVLWIVPHFALRNLAVVVAFSPAIHSILTSFRSRFVLFSLALISSFVLCLASSILPIMACMVLLGAYLILHFVRRFRVAFSHSTVFTERWR